MKVEKVSLGEFIKRKRQYYGFSQRELARRTGISNSMICRIENGEIKKPIYQILWKLSDELGLQLPKVLSLAGYSSEELATFGLIVDYTSIKGCSKISNYTSEFSKGQEYLDLLKVLRGYKNNELTDEEVFGLFSYRTGIDMTNYILPCQKNNI